MLNHPNPFVRKGNGMKHGEPETGRNGAGSRVTAIPAIAPDADLWRMDFRHVFEEIRRKAFERLESLDRVVEAKMDERAIAAILAKSLPHN